VEENVAFQHPIQVGNLFGKRNMYQNECQKKKKKIKKKKKKTHHISNSKLHLFTNSPSEQEKVMTEREREGE